MLTPSRAKNIYKIKLNSPHLKNPNDTVLHSCFKSSTELSLDFKFTKRTLSANPPFQIDI